MPSQNQFVEGLNPTGLATMSASQLLQLIREARPETYIGMVYVGTTQPDIVSNPQYARYLWLDTNNALNPRIKVYTGAAWIPYSFEYDEISGEAINDLTIKLGKLDPDGGTANYLVGLNGAGTAFILKDPAALFPANSFPVASLVQGADSQVLKTLGGVIQWGWITPSEFLAAFGGAIPIDYLDKSGATVGQVPTVDGTGHLVYSDIPTPVVPSTSIPTQVVFEVLGGEVPGIGLNYVTKAWVVPAGVTKLKIKCWAAGGGGESFGGGAGGYSEGCFVVSASQAVDIRLGYGGAGYIVVGPVSSLTGGDTEVRIATVLKIKAIGGNAGDNTTGFGLGGMISAAADIHMPGGSGNDPYYDGAFLSGGRGGDCPMGGQGGMGYPATIAMRITAGCNPGGGGGGGAMAAFPTPTRDGGQGGHGMVVIEY